MSEFARRFVTKWIARFDAVRGLIQAFSLVVTAFSTFSIMLQGFGYGWLVPYLGGASALLMVILTYAYSEYDFYRDKQKWLAWYGSNYAGPDSRIVAEHVARSIIAGQEESELTEEQVEAVQSELDTTFESLIDGIDLDQYE